MGFVIRCGCRSQALFSKYHLYSAGMMPSIDREQNILELDPLLRGLGVKWRPAGRIRDYLQRWIGLTWLNTVCRKADLDVHDMRYGLQARLVTDAAEIGRAITVSSDIAAAARSGPVIFIANHPFGIADVLVTTEFIDSIRSDYRIVANRLAGGLHFNDRKLIWVDPFHREQSRGLNQVALRQCISHLKGGGALLFFPGGICSHFDFRSWSVTDPYWTDHAARLSAQSGASIVPMYVAGRNSLLFQVLGLIHPRLRTMLLLREFAGLSGKTVYLSVGRMIAPNELQSQGNSREVTSFLRARVYEQRLCRIAARPTPESS